MISDKDIKKLRLVFMNPKINVEQAASKVNICENTARKYLLNEVRLPSEIIDARSLRQYLTRQSPFDDIYDEIDKRLKAETEEGNFVAKELFEYFQNKYPGKFPDSQLRSFQRLVKNWRATKGKDKEVFFKQKHNPGELAQTDFVRLKSLGIRVDGVLCESLLFHYVLTFSKWEYFELCASESFESLSSGFQNAVFASGGVPLKHQTDSLTAAINKNCSRDHLTDRYRSLMSHYKTESRNTNARCPNENGTVEVMHGHIKKSIIHALEMRGSYNFKNYEELKKFLKKLNKKKNSNRYDKFLTEKKKLKPLPAKKLPAVKKEKTKVGPGSTIRVGKKTYSVESKLIGETISAHLFSNRVEVWYGDKLMNSFDRIFGEVSHKINYRHVIKWFVRKPGAFENYYYKTDMFPTTYFRMAYDQLKKENRLSGTKTYLEILNLAAFNSEDKVNEVLNSLLNSQEEISFDKVKKLIEADSPADDFMVTKVSEPDLSDYDNL